MDRNILKTSTCVKKLALVSMAFLLAFCTIFMVEKPGVFAEEGSDQVLGTLRVLQHSKIQKQDIIDLIKLEGADKKSIIQKKPGQNVDLDAETRDAGEKNIQVSYWIGDLSTTGYVKLIVAKVTVDVTPGAVIVEQNKEIEEAKLLEKVTISPEYRQANKAVSLKPETKEAGNKKAKVAVSFPNGDKIEKEINVDVVLAPTKKPDDSAGSEGKKEEDKGQEQNPEAKPQADTNPQVEKKPEVDPKKENDSKPQAESQTNTKPEAEAKPKPEAAPKKESKPAEKKAEPKPSISFKSTSQDLTKEARTTSGKIKVNVDEESAKLVGAKDIEIKGHSYAKTAGFNPLNHELYDISLLDKNGNKITEFKRGFEAEVLLPVKSGREVLAVKHFLDPKDSTKQETLPSKEVEIAGQKYRKIKVSHFSVYGIEYKPVSEGKDKLPDTGASAGATSALVMLMGLGIAFFAKKK